MFYHDLDVWIERGAGDFLELKSSCRAHGEYRDCAPLDEAALASTEVALADRVIAMDRQVALGASLFHTLFVGAAGSIQFHLGQCLGGSQAERSRGVRLRLRCATPDLARVPWEYLYSPMLGGFLGASARTPVVRYLELPRPILDLQCPMPARMLLVIPEGSGLDTAAEKDRLFAAMQALDDVVTCTVLEGRVTEADVAHALQVGAYQLFHFIGHGAFENDTAYVLLNKPAGSGWDSLDHDRFGSLFANHATLRLVVLNSCKGAEVSSLKPFVGMAPALVRQGIAAVVAMHYEILDKEAIVFATAFYESLFRSPDRGRVELAMSHARHSLARAFPNTGAVGTPVLFMHAKEGVLFDPEARSAIGAVPVSPRAIARTAAVQRTHQENLRVLLAEPIDATREKLVAQESNALSRVERRLRLGVASILAGTTAALATGYLALVVGFFALPPWARIETYAIWASDLSGHRDLDRRIRLVSIGPDSQQWVRGERFSASWRPAHAVVVDRLREAGASVIVLGFTLPDTTANDAPLALALRRARAAGTHVVIAANDYDDGVPRVGTSFAPFVDAGFACLREQRAHSAKSIPILAEGPRVGERPRLSLPLQTVAKVRGESVAALDRSARTIVMRNTTGEERRVGLFDVSPAEVADSLCHALVRNEDMLANQIIAYSSVDDLRAPDRRLEYLAVFNGAQKLPDLRGTIVVIGAELDTFPVWRGFRTERRYGPELLVDAINTVLSGIVIRPASDAIQLLVVVLLTSIGAGIGAATRLRSTAQQLAVLGASAAGYILMAGALFGSQHLMLNTVFHMLALVISFAAVRFVRRTWFAA